MLRARSTLILVSLALGLGAAAVSCTDSEPANKTGVAGSTGQGAAGSTQGAAGSTQGAAGSTQGAAGAGVAGSGAAGSGAAGSGADAGTDSGSSGGSISFATDIYPIIMTGCTPCHTKTTSPDGQLDMSSATNAYKALLGTATPVTGAAAKTDLACKLLDAKKLRVEPNDAAHSYVYIKIATPQTMLTSNSCGAGMPEKPQSTLTLTTDQITKIQSWINGGAQP